MTWKVAIYLYAEIIVLPLRFSSRAADLCGVSIWKDSQLIARGSKAGDTSHEFHHHGE